MKLIRYSLFFLLITKAGTLLSQADTVMLRDHVGQLVGSVVMESADAVIVDISGVLLSVRRSDVQYVVRGGMQSGAPGMAPQYNQQPQPQAFEQQIQSEIAQMVSPATNNEIFPTTPSIDSNPVPGDVSQPNTGAFPFSTGTEQIQQHQTTQPESPLPLLPVFVPTGKVYQVVGFGIRFREGPNLTYPTITTLPAKSVLIEIETSDSWLRARTTDGQEGWIHLNFVQPMLNQPCLVTGENVNVREMPGDQLMSRSFGRLHLNDLVIRLEEQAEWSHVLVGDNLAGWVSNQYLDPVEDISAIKPQLRMFQNADAGMPVLIEKTPSIEGHVKTSLTVRDDNMVSGGMTKLCVLHRDAALFSQESNYISESIINRERLKTPLEILGAGFPEEVGVTYIGMDILTMLGTRVADGWKYELTLPDAQSISYGVIVQKGESRGTIIHIP